MKKIFSSLSVLCLLFTGTMLNAQQNYHRCSAFEHLQEQLQADPDLTNRMQEIERQTTAFVQSGQTGSRSVVTIPVVVHVVYNTSAQNISDALIQAQINQLNLDYAKLNSDAGSVPAAFAGVAANTNVQFCLAQRDPSGNASTGIVRKSTTVTSFSTNDVVKKSAQGGDDAWDATKYLNLWVCNLGGGLLGYAQFPGGSATTDGVVVLYSSVGSMVTPGSASPYNFGRTATHEIGHWLNLYHIWGDDGTACTGTDNVSDTPNQSSENYGCPTYPHTDACSASSPGVMFMNYMDYTDDGCMNMFTAGQAARMNALFATGGARVGLLTSLGCQPVVTCASATALNVTGVSDNAATLNWTAPASATGYNVHYRAVGAASWTTASTTATSYAVSGLTAGTAYEFQVQTVCSSGTSAYTASTNFTTTGTAPCNTPGTLSTTAITTTTATFNWAAVTGAVSYAVQYRIVGAATWNSASSSTTSYAASGLTASSNYEWQVATNCAAGSSAYSASTLFTTATPSTCSDIYESNNSSGTAKTPTLNTNLNGFITPSTDVDWFKFTTVSPATKIQVDLTTLPADYDMTLYKSNASTKISTSQNGGTTSEQIKYNATTAGTYYLKVYGYNGATNATNCYTLKISTSSTSFRLADGSEEAGATIDAVAVPVMKVYPNPAQDQINVEFLSEAKAQVKLSVYNLNGEKVLGSEATAEEGLNTQTVNTNTLSSGVYVMEVYNNGETQRMKFTIAK